MSADAGLGCRRLAGRIDALSRAPPRRNRSWPVHHASWQMNTLEKADLGLKKENIQC
jgi:hypothetical protein